MGRRRQKVQLELAFMAESRGEAPRAATPRVRMREQRFGREVERHGRVKVIWGHAPEDKELELALKGAT